MENRVWFVLKNATNDRLYREKDEHWHPYTRKINHAKWYGTYDAAESARKRRQDPDKWKVSTIVVSEQGQPTMLSDMTPMDRIDRLEKTIRELFPEAGTVGAKMIAGEVIQFCAEANG